MIDHDDDGGENVYFMNLVDEEDLFSLLNEDAQAEYLAANQITIMEEVEETETEDEEEIEEEPEVTTEKKSNWAPLMLLAIVVAGGAGYAGYTYVTKKKQAYAEYRQEKTEAQELLIAQCNIASLYDAERKEEEFSAFQRNAQPSQSDDR